MIAESPFIFLPSHNTMTVFDSAVFCKHVPLLVSSIHGWLEYKVHVYIGSAFDMYGFHVTKFSYIWPSEHVACKAYNRYSIYSGPEIHSTVYTM